MNLSLPAQLGLHRLNPRTSIGGSLITGFLLIALLSAGALGWMLYGVSSRSLEATYREKLNLVALRKSMRRTVMALLKGAPISWTG